MTDHLVIPDTQVSYGVPADHLTAIGNMIVDRKPEVVVHLGDHADLPSLCSANNRLQYEGARYQQDVESALEGMEKMLSPLREYNESRAKNNKKQYRPRMVLTIGNHEHRITRLLEEDPRLIGAIGLGDLRYEEFGWEVYPFLDPVNIDGVNYVHYAKQLRSPRPIERAHLIAQRKLASFTVGHTQGLEYYVSHGSYETRDRIQCIIAGSCYLHDEEYQGAQGNPHWRGLIYKHSVENGQYDPEFISVERLIKEYR